MKIEKYSIPRRLPNDSIYLSKPSQTDFRCNLEQHTVNTFTVTLKIHHHPLRATRFRKTLHRNQNPTVLSSETPSKAQVPQHFAAVTSVIIKYKVTAKTKPAAAATS